MNDEAASAPRARAQTEPSKPASPPASRLGGRLLLLLPRAAHTPQRNELPQRRPTKCHSHDTAQPTPTTSACASTHSRFSSPGERERASLLLASAYPRQQSRFTLEQSACASTSFAAHHTEARRTKQQHTPAPLARALFLPIPTMLRTALAGAAGGAAAYAAADLAADIAAFNSLQRQALELAERDPEGSVERAVGPKPWRPARWHAGSGATLAYSHRGHAARATFALTGPQGVTDVVARGVRGPGYAWNALYHAFGEGRWELASCAAMVPAAGGVAKPHELMEPRSLAQAWEAAGGEVKVGKLGGGGGGGGGGVVEERREEGGGGGAGGSKASAAADGSRNKTSSGRAGRSWWPLWRREKAAGEESSSRRPTAA
jgi:hypothetical protein